MHSIEIPEGALDQIVGPVFEAMFGVALEPLAERGPLDGALCASIRIRGDWDGFLAVETTPALAVDLARLLLALDEPPPARDAQDALAEITNTIAGNFKSAFTPGARLALPASGNPAAGAPAVEAFSYLCGTQPLRVSRYSA